MTFIVYIEEDVEEKKLDKEVEKLQRDEGKITKSNQCTFLDGVETFI